VVGGADAENDGLEKDDGWEMGEWWENGEDDVGSMSGYTGDRKGS
jgi:hypothetical protein